VGYNVPRDESASIAPMAKDNIIPDLQALAKPISDLRLATQNPRRGDVEAIARSLAEFGQHKPLVATRDGEVIIGNHTLKAALSLGWEEIAVAYTDDDSTTAKARLLADNKISERGRTDNAEVAALLAEIVQDSNDLLAATGYQDGEVEALLRLTQPATPTVQNDEPDPIRTNEPSGITMPPRAATPGVDRTNVPPRGEGDPVRRIEADGSTRTIGVDGPGGTVGIDDSSTIVDSQDALDNDDASNHIDALDIENVSNTHGVSNRRRVSDRGDASKDVRRDSIPAQCQLYLGDCRDVMENVLEDDCIDAIITDPGGQDGKDVDGWWRKVPGVGFWGDVLRVAKPGAHMCVFAGRRTWHRVAICAEDAGWELRDTVMWVYGKGMPMSLDIGQAVDRKLGGDGAPYFREVGSMTDEQRAAYVQGGSNPFYGYGTELRPSWEPILLFRKPVEGTIAENVAAYGTGALNIDATRVGGEERDAIATWVPEGQGEAHGHGLDKKQLTVGVTTLGRWPADAVFEDGGVGGAADVLDGQSGRSHASRFFYCPKVSKRERDEGLAPGVNDCKGVKPVALIEWLVSLITPGVVGTGSSDGGAVGAGTGCGVVLDPFCGTGSTGVVVSGLGFGFVGIDCDAHVLNDVAAVRLGLRE